MNQIFNSCDIADRLGTKAPWRLLDWAQKKDSTHFAGVKYFTVNEAFFVGHFPVHPITPGVLLIEAMRQLCLFFAPGKPSAWMLTRLNKVKFRRPVLPGDRMCVEAELLESTGEELSFALSCATASGNCCEAKLTLGKRPESVPVLPFMPLAVDRTADIEKDTDQVMALMPHRYPFLLVDYISKTEGSVVTAVKNVTGNETFFDSGFSCLPEVLLCEIAAQAGCANMLSRPENKGKLGFFMAIENAEFHRLIQPGEQLIIKSDLPVGKSRFGKGPGKIYAGGELVFEITLMFAIVDA